MDFAYESTTRASAASLSSAARPSTHTVPAPNQNTNGQICKNDTQEVCHGMEKQHCKVQNISIFFLMDVVQAVGFIRGADQQVYAEGASMLPVVRTGPAHGCSPSRTFTELAMHLQWQKASALFPKCDRLTAGSAWRR